MTCGALVGAAVESSPANSGNDGVTLENLIYSVVKNYNSKRIWPMLMSYVASIDPAAVRE